MNKLSIQDRNVLVSKVNSLLRSIADNNKLLEIRHSYSLLYLKTEQDKTIIDSECRSHNHKAIYSVWMVILGPALDYTSNIKYKIFIMVDEYGVFYIVNIPRSDTHIYASIVWNIELCKGINLANCGYGPTTCDLLHVVDDVENLKEPITKSIDDVILSPLGLNDLILLGLYYTIKDADYDPQITACESDKMVIYCDGTKIFVNDGCIKLQSLTMTSTPRGYSRHDDIIISLENNQDINILVLSELSKR